MWAHILDSEIAYGHQNNRSIHAQLVLTICRVELPHDILALLLLVVCGSSPNLSSNPQNLLFLSQKSTILSIKKIHCSYTSSQHYKCSCMLEFSSFWQLWRTSPQAQIGYLDLYLVLPNFSSLIYIQSKDITSFGTSCNSFFRIIKTHILKYSYFDFWFFVSAVLGFEFRAPWSLGRHSSTWATPSALLYWFLMYEHCL
jgi:hypothetical protein